MPLAQSLQEARTQVEQLVERFHRNLDAYKRPDYKEEQARVEFINPFFEALGWDVRNTKGYAEPFCAWRVWRDQEDCTNLMSPVYNRSCGPECIGEVGSKLREIRG